MMHEIKTAIIDDGVNEKLYSTGHLWLNLEITRELQIRQRAGDFTYEPSHGTTCAAIIKKYSPNAVLGSIKVLNETHRGVREQLVTALYWCADNEIKLVNLSLGTIDFRDYEAVRKAVNYACRKGVIIVAACNNKNVYTHPASLSNVIGVKADREEKLEEGQYRYHCYPLDGIEITSCASHSLVKYDHSGKTTSSCNSFAAPMITAIVHTILQKNPSMSLEEIKSKLAEGAVNAVPESCRANLYRGIDWAEEAVLFDIDCPGIRKMPIPYKFNIKSTIDIACNSKREGVEKVYEYIKKNAEVVREADTIVINMGGSTGKEDKTNLLDLIDTLEEDNKNLVYLDEDSECQNFCNAFRKRKIKLFHPSVYTNGAGVEKAFIDIPVIAVYDFSGRELLNCISKLKDIFCENGYNAIAVSDVYGGIAAGIEYLPLSNETEDITLEHINRVYDPDVILLGVSGLDKKCDAFIKLGERYEVDVKILISGGENCCLQKVIDAGAKSETILVTASEGYKNSAERIVDISCECYTGVLFGYIIELFKEKDSFLGICSMENN